MQTKLRLLRMQVQLFLIRTFGCYPSGLKDFSYRNIFNKYTNISNVLLLQKERSTLTHLTIIRDLSDFGTLLQISAIVYRQVLQLIFLARLLFPGQQHSNTVCPPFSRPLHLILSYRNLLQGVHFI